MAKAYTLIHVDGASIGNPGPAGAGAVIKYPGGRVERCKAHLGKKTCNEAELWAAVKALEKIPEGSRVTLMSDSQYVVKGFNGVWQVVTNQALWNRLRKAAARHSDVMFGWIPREINLEADRLAGKAARKE